ncbi:hypothetical protein LEP1GSC082_1632 [Leptospira kirschneri str. H2]|uniref:Uncharacterized protein n=1 Tax=Leptospira kirschneri str. H1 TaxID=1049966 RepID=A0A0E2AY44_9LEPT|nr:hypothetical protein LEP1GSC081_3006 [Leptospira kirschneri str. H1]EKO58666.1 hypothetical protein LEP1GSC082_1632 [Leptospira kirschneri str. H2]
MMTAKQRFCAKIKLDDDFFVFYSSSHKFQSLTGKSMIVRVPTD